MKKQIILADDDPDDRLIYDLALREVLCEDDYRIEFAHHGEDVMVKVQREAVLPSMVFLDLNMPRLDGRECLVQLRKLASKEELPIVMLSTSSAEKDIQETFNLGANMYIQKPTDFKAVKELFHRCLCTNGCVAASSTMEGYFYRMAS